MTSTIPRGFYVAGTWAETAGVRQIVCPADMGPVGAVAECTGDDAAAAVLAARKAFDQGTWATEPERRRGDLLLRIADLLQRDHAVYTKAEALDTGQQRAAAEDDLAGVIGCFRSYGRGEAALAEVPTTGGTPTNRRVVHEPVGVCALLTGWNHPLLQLSRTLAPALLAGNTVVLKPAERTPSTAILLMDTLMEAGLPAGVANLVTGTGQEVGSVLTTHPGVDLVSVTGSLEAGQAVLAAAAPLLKRVVLECGGRTSILVFADAERESALDSALGALLGHSGRRGPAGPRLLVQDTIAEGFVDELVARAELVRMGGPFDEKAEVGPLISFPHRDDVHGSVRAAVAEGARLRCGGDIPTDPALSVGSFYPPTVLDHCTTSMACVREEAAGPVLTVETFADEEQAVALANDTRHAPAAAIWTADAGRADRLAEALRCRAVWVNGDAEPAPSGLGAYRETKQIWHPATPGPQP